MEVHLYPAGCTRNVLAMILSPPALDKAHANRTHLCELVHGLETLVDRESQKLGKLLIIKDLQTAVRRDLADSCRVKTVGMIALSALDKDGIVAEALGEDLASDVE